MNKSIVMTLGVMCLLAQPALAECTGNEQKQLEVFNRAADWAYDNWHNYPQSESVFHKYMKKVLELSGKGCILPASDRQSVLLRAGQLGNQRVENRP